MVNNSITFIGLDTHKEFFEVAYLEDSRDAKPVSLGRINGTKPALRTSGSGLAFCHSLRKKSKDKT